MLAILFWLAVLFIVYTYLMYPLVLFFLTRGRRSPCYITPNEWPRASIIIAAHNEEAIIRQKIENTLSLDYPCEALEIIVASDGSTDLTNQIVAEYLDRGVRLYALEEQGGKTRAQNKACQQIQNNILVFSDANSMYDRHALKSLIRPFSDNNIGCVCGELRYVNPSGHGVGKGEGLYWRYEQFLKRRESLLSSALGANGSIYALRRELFEDLDPDIISDFVMPIRVWMQGFRVVYESSAIAQEYTGDTFLKEFQRRTRIIARSLFGLWSQRSVLNLFKHRAFAFQMISHKLMRWLVPLALLLIFGLNGFLAGNVFYYSLWILQFVFYGLALGGSIMPRTVGKYALFYIPAHFCAMNIGAFLGLLRFLTGRRYRAWQPMSRN